MKHYLVTLNVRHGEAVAIRKHLVTTNNLAPSLRAFENEASFIGEELDQFERGDGGFYSRTGEFHYKLDSVVEVPEAEAAILKKYL